MTMQRALRVETTILPGGRIEISNPQLRPGENVEIIIVLPSQGEPTKKRSALDILAEASGHRLFKSAEDVDNYLRQERDSWEN